MGRISLSGKKLVFWGTLSLIALIAILFWWLVDLELVAKYLFDLKWGDVALASILLVAGLAAHAGRWWYLLGYRVSFKLAFDAANLCHMLNMWLPLRPGEPARIYLVGRTGEVSYSETTGTVVMDRWLDNVMRYGLLALAVAIGLGAESGAAAAVSGVLFVVVLFAAMSAVVIYREAVLRTWPRWLAHLPWVTEEGAQNAISGVVDGISDIRSLRELTRLFVWSLAIWLLLILSYYAVLLAFPFELPPLQMWTIAIGAAVLSPPTAATEPGLFHASVVAPLTLIGLDPAVLTAFAVVAHLLQNVWLTGLGLLGMVRLPEARRISFAPSHGAD
ncbi:MAG: flippase-like domain-containing protein [Caldilineaceae bacterium]|nr:flippase-like domain-containing protein [Caldilineaceae bacterium]